MCRSSHTLHVLLFLVTRSMCVACPANSISPSCYCNAGYSGYPGDECTVCEAGSYSTGAGEMWDRCEKCGPDTYSVTTGATGAATCLACPQNSGALWFGSYTSTCPCNPGYTGGNFISRYSSTACARFISLTRKPSIASVSTRNNPTVGSSVLPTYNALGGPNGKGHVSFNRAQSQYLNTGSLALNINTNGGFTVVIVFRLTGVAMDSEVILDMQGPASGIKIYRYENKPDFWFSVNGLYLDTSYYFGPSQNMFVQNSWHILKFWYRSYTQEVLFQINDVEILGGLSDSPIPDITVSSYLGTSSTQYALNADIAGFFLVDEYMTGEAMISIANDMLHGMDLTNTTCPSGNVCTQCSAGKYKTSIGSAACTACSCSELTCNASTGCTCNAGYTGPKGGPCTPCAAGQYKDVPGYAQCQDNPAWRINQGQDCSWMGNGGLYDGLCTDYYFILFGSCSNCCFSCGHVCPDGGSGIITGSCSSCAAGKYSTTATTTCVVCPTNSNSPSQSTALVACTCNAGYTGPDGGVCTTCDVGTYKSVTGSAACTDGGAGTYSERVGATAYSCVKCHANSSTSTRSSSVNDCVCNPGYGSV